jgi:hypothetical protein
MQAGLIHAGEYYAYFNSPPKGVIPLGAKKCRVRDVKKVKGLWDTNAKTVVDIVIVDTGRELQVRARDIISYWDEYERESAFLLREKEERDAAHRERVEKMEKQRRRDNVRTGVVQTILEDRFMDKGILATGQVTVGYSSISFPLRFWIEYFAITDDEIEESIDRIMDEKGE